MNEKQSLEVIKAALDLATSKGVWSNLNDCNAIIQAFNVLAKKIEDAKNDGNING